MRTNKMTENVKKTATEKWFSPLFLIPFWASKSHTESRHHEVAISSSHEYRNGWTWSPLFSSLSLGTRGQWSCSWMLQSPRTSPISQCLPPGICSYASATISPKQVPENLMITKKVAGWGWINKNRSGVSFSFSDNCRSAQKKQFST